MRQAIRQQDSSIKQDIQKLLASTAQEQKDRTAALN